MTSFLIILWVLSGVVTLVSCVVIGILADVMTRGEYWYRRGGVWDRWEPVWNAANRIFLVSGVIWIGLFVVITIVDFYNPIVL